MSLDRKDTFIIFRIIIIVAEQRNLDAEQEYFAIEMEKGFSK